MKRPRQKPAGQAAHGQNRVRGVRAVILLTTDKNPPGRRHSLPAGGGGPTTAEDPGRK